MHCLVIRSTPFLIVIDEQIVGYVQFLNDIQLLIYTANARSLCDHRVAQMYLLSININFALIRLVYAGKHLDQRGLAGAIYRR